MSGFLIIFRCGLHAKIIHLKRLRMNKHDEQVVADFKRRISSDLVPLVRKIIIFGSRAKGEEREDSDLDMVVLVDELQIDVEKKLDDIAYNVMWDNDFKPIISLKVFSEKRFLDMISRGFSFYKHVQNEGICL